MKVRYFDSEDLFLGMNEIERPCFINRSIHTQIIGATGTGKTIAALFPMILHAIRLKSAVIFIDPKGDVGTFEILTKLARHMGREKDLLRLDLADIKGSAKYSPFKVGGPSELKDKIVGSIIWTEEFYKKIAEGYLLDVFLFLERAKIQPSLEVICDIVLNDASDLREKFEGHEILDAALEELVDEGKKQKENLAGLRTDLKLWARSEFGSAISDTEGTSVLDWILENKIVYINLNTLAFEETARRFGRLVVQDLKTASQRIQYIPESKRPSTGVFIDEFATVASSGFIDLLNKVRSANINMTLAHQSFGDLETISKSFPSQVVGNTDLKIIFRVDCPETSDFFSRAIGTAMSEKVTNQTQATAVGGTTKTGLGTSRETDEFIIDPNLLRRLKRGEAVVYRKQPDFKVEKVKLNPISAWMGILDERTNYGRGRWSELFEILWS